ncbi:MAG: (d)CMP kinase [Firmicutes bacterium]|uniref:Cytidylate kinase n=1 Tax=Candidatus Scybalomonas excrementavium TaxID=2840943 RepID=A0A9D9I143_9FIRM|nr:(d)CMP kinase [Candidatus Scybalomonas excrementavium]
MMNIAIDGPAGAGKSTIAKRVAKQLGFIYVDTGAMFRAMGLYFLRNQFDMEQKSLLEEESKKIDIALKFENGEQQVLLNGENVNGYIRVEEVGKIASIIATNPAIRTRLLELQQKIARENHVVMDGRDIGTCVLPNAQVKIYLTASSKERARRRYEELIAKGEQCDIAIIEEDIIQRDYADMNREIAPLRQAKDAVLIDSSDMTIEEVVHAILNEYEQKK